MIEKKEKIFNIVRSPPTLVADRFALGSRSRASAIAVGGITTELHNRGDDKNIEIGNLLLKELSYVSYIYR